MSESFLNPAAKRKVEREIAAFREYQQLSRSFVTVNEKICQLRPVEDTLTPEEKKRQKRSSRQEIGRLLRVIFAGWRKTGSIDLEAVEMLVRDSMHQLGPATLSHLLSLSGPRPATVECACGRPAHLHDTRPKQLLTVVGRVRCQRAYHICPHCQAGHVLRDAELDVVGTACSPGVRRMMAAVGSDARFDRGREQLAVLAGLEVTTKAVGRHAAAIGADIAGGEQAKIDRAVQLELPQILGKSVPVIYMEMDGTQVPMGRAELEGRTGRIEGRPARTRKVKLGCVFTQTTIDLIPKADPFVRKPPPLTSAPGKPLSGLAVVFIPKLGARLEPGRQESRAGRRSRLDLEYGRPTLLWRGADRGYLARARAPLGFGG